MYSWYRYYSEPRVKYDASIGIEFFSYPRFYELFIFLYVLYFMEWHPFLYSIEITIFNIFEW